MTPYISFEPGYEYTQMQASNESAIAAYENDGWRKWIVYYDKPNLGYSSSVGVLIMRRAL